MTASERVQEILKLVAEAEGVQTCEIFANETVFNGDGGSSECFRGSIQSKDANGAKMIKVFIKPDFDKLDYYLDLYYHSFSKFAKELGADPDKLLPLEALKSDWKKYALMGIYMAFMVWEFKLLDKNEFQARIAETPKGQDTMEEFFDIIKKSREHPSYKKTLADILIHAVEYGII
ncbi:hypothetical protein HUJ04_013055 [Dendroctonus ponderosae]|nr:hypothetical protein HUJ04_013055 [Dendroctonus ponderosae]